jgi:hypothetical protein
MEGRKMKTIVGTIMIAMLVTMIAVVGALSPVAYAQDWTGNVNFFLGAKVLDEDDWEPADEHDEFGVLVDFKKNKSAISFAIDYLHSEGDESVFDWDTGYLIDIDAETSELNIGIRKIWDQSGTVRPYIGGGLAYIYAEYGGRAMGISVSDDDRAFGFWLNGGIYWTLGNSFNVGLDLRYSYAEVSLYGIEGNAGGGHAGILVGYHW